ncbi:hypothetical protein K0B04_03195, partial [Patescibacteria group bacterium]|nr:hypothetical protein [Patescibacteria group bacterium]
KIYLIIGYLMIAGLLTIYIRNVLRREALDVYIEKEVKEVEKEYQTNVTLKYYNGNRITEYKKRMTNLDSVYDFLYELRSKDNLIFEIDRYTYGTEMLSVYEKLPQSGYKWAVILDEEDITNYIDSIDLEDGMSFELRVIKIEN